MNPVSPKPWSKWLNVVTLIALEGHLLAWGEDPGSPSGDIARKPSGSVGLQSPERIPMVEIFFQAKEDASGSKSAESRDAIVGEGFFQIQMPDGVLAYTRNGSFKVASDGRVVTRDGLHVLVNMQPIPPNTTGVIVTAHGEVFVTTTSGSFASGLITLVRFANPAGLKPIGSELFLESEASGSPETGGPGVDGIGVLGDGFLRLPGSFGFTTQLTPTRRWIDVEVSLDAKVWTVLASGVSSSGEKLFVRDIRAADFEFRFYRVRSRPFPLPPANSQ